MNAIKHLVGMAFLVFSIVSCNTSVSPEDRIKEYVGAVENHFEKRQASGLKKYISEGYRDDYGYTKKDLLRFAAGYILRRPIIHITSKAEEILILKDTKTAHVKIDVAVSSKPLTGTDIRLIQSEFHRFHLTLQRNKKWQLSSLQWQNITIDEYLAP